MYYHSRTIKTLEVNIKIRYLKKLISSDDTKNIEPTYIDSSFDEYLVMLDELKISDIKNNEEKKIV